MAKNAISEVLQFNYYYVISLAPETRFPRTFCLTTTTLLVWSSHEQGP